MAATPSNAQGRRPRTVLITGGSRNIGARMAERFAALGDAVVITGRSEAALEEAARPIRAAGGEVSVVAGDVGVREDLERMVSVAEERYGGVDVLINNAVSRMHKPFVETTEDDVAEVFAISALAPLRLSQAVVPGMLDRGWGRLLYMLGSAVSTGGQQRAALVAAKHSMIGLMKALAKEFAGSGITANAVSPGVVATQRGLWTAKGESEAELQKRYAESAKRVPMGRMADMDEICAAFEYLAGSESGFTTGQILHVNGGSYFGS